MALRMSKQSVPPAVTIERLERANSDCMARGNKGAYSEIVACAWLMKNGYEVFRAVSPHGPIDLIAIKGGVCEYFDVKSAAKGFPARTLEQQQLGVKILRVRPDGSCEIQPGRVPWYKEVAA
jgi:hypothetical protein